jgi:hypothetical protein
LVSIAGNTLVPDLWRAVVKWFPRCEVWARPEVVRGSKAKEQSGHFMLASSPRQVKRVQMKYRNFNHMKVYGVDGFLET